MIGRLTPAKIVSGEKALRYKYLIAALAASALAPAALAGGSCKVSRVAELPVTMFGLRPLVHAKINGKEATFIADSGAWFSMISPGSAAEYGLTLEPLPPWFRMSGVGGTVVPKLTTLKSFTIAGVDIPKVQFLVGGSEVGSVGLLGQNVLALLDTEFDLAHGMIKLMKSQGCSNVNLAYWAPAGGFYSVLDTERMDDERPHIVASIYVNGVKLRALFDTGASTSFVSLKAAARIGLKPGGEGVTPAGESSGIGRKLVSTWIGPVGSIKIGDEEIKNSRLRFGGDFDETDMLIGADFFLSHHIYWSDRLHKLYFTFNGGHVFDLHYLRVADDDEAPPPPAAAAKVASAEPDPTDAAGFSRRGNARASRGDVPGGLADLDQAVKMAPEDVDFLWQRAVLHARMRQPAKAVEDTDRLLKLRPGHVDALLMRAELRRSQDHAADIRSDVDAAAAAAVKSADQRLEIAGLYDELEDYQRASDQYSIWIAAHPDDSKRFVALNGRCWALAMTGRELDRALKDCNAALAIRPHTPAFLDSRGLVRVRMGDYAKAIMDYDEALKASPDMAWSHYGRGIAKLRLGQKEAGEADLAKAKALDPKLHERAKKLGIAP